MTFIASVIANNGVAIIADSLVTTSTPTLQLNEFFDYFQKKSKSEEGDELTLNPKELIGLFKSRPSFTKDYEEKLFYYDDYTAITTAGAARINNKRIGEIVETIVEKNKLAKGYSRKKIETKIKELIEDLTLEIRNHLKARNSIGQTTLVVTNYNKKTHITSVFKLVVQPATKEKLEEENFDFVISNKSHDWEKVVCDGQNRIRENFIWPLAGYI